MVVAYDHIYSLCPGIFDLLIGLDAAIQSDDQSETAVAGPVYSLERKAIALVITVGNIEVDFLGISPQERIYERHRRRAVDIVVAVNQYLFLGGDGLADSFHRSIHILHQEGIVEIVKAGTEEGTRLLEGFYTPLDKQFGQDTVNAEFGGKPSHLLRIGRIFDYPFALLCHITQI